MSFNLFVLGRSLAIDIVIGFSQMVVLATGGMNLSVGSIGVCVVMMGAIRCRSRACQSRWLARWRWFWAARLVGLTA